MKARKKNTRQNSGSSRDVREVRAAFVVNMFREFPDRIFSIKQLVAASGGNSRDARYMVRDIVEALVEGGVVVRHGHDKYQLSMEQLPRYVGIVDMVGSGAAYVRVEELDSDIYINHRNTNFALDGDKVEVALHRPSQRESLPIWLLPISISRLLLRVIPSVTYIKNEDSKVAC